METSGIRNILAESEFAVDMEWTLRTWNAELRVLVDKALGLVFEGCACLIIPPARVTARLIVLRSSVVKCYPC